MAFPGTYNFNYYRGDSFDFIINPKNPNGTVFDLSFYDDARFTIANTRSASPSFSLSASATLDPANARIVCEIPSEVGETLPPGSYVYDIEIKDVETSKVYTLVTGNIAVTQDVTQPGVS
jgi:hypothetical protein